MTKPSPDVEYQRLTKHLDDLDERIFQLLSLYLKLVTAVIAGTFYLSSKDGKNVSWAKGADLVFGLVSLTTVVLILQRLFAWYGYRKTLSKKFPDTGRPNCCWWLSEAFMCVVVVNACFLFYRFNPLRF